MLRLPRTLLPPQGRAGFGVAPGLRAQGQRWAREAACVRVSRLAPAAQALPRKRKMGPAASEQTFPSRGQTQAGFLHLPACSGFSLWKWPIELTFVDPIFHAEFHTEFP